MKRKAPFSFDLYASLTRISTPVPSPDGGCVVFAGTRLDLSSNQTVTHLFVQDLDGSEEPRRLTTHGSVNAEPCWSPDGSRVAFVSNRGGSRQLWTLPAQGGDAACLSDVPFGLMHPAWSPDGAHICFSALVDLRDPSREGEAGGEWRVFDELLFRHWNAWLQDRAWHILVVLAAGGTPRDLTPGRHHAPPLALAGPPYYAFSPDGEEICFPSNRSAAPARTTAIELYRVPVKGGAITPITRSDSVNAFAAYSPDGSSIAFTTMHRPGYEADRRSLALYDRGSGDIRLLCKDFPLSIGPPVWDPRGLRIYFCALEKGRSSLWSVRATGGDPARITQGWFDTGVQAVPGRDAVVFLRQSASVPPGIAVAQADGGSPVRLPSSSLCDTAGVELRGLEGFSFPGALGTTVHGFVLKPPGFDARRKHRTLFLIHGGPQAAWNDEFHDRWNAQIFASWGYVVVLINPRGSIGYGDRFKEEVSCDWGGRFYEDLILGFRHVLENFPFVDAGRLAAAGGSVGGYMINWLAGHTDLFKCLVTHGSIFNTESFAYSTEEHWFVEWEFGGRHWDTNETQRKWSPHLHVGRFKTPLLVLHGEKDYRCPVSEGIQAFTAARLKGVCARLVLFPDEGHWITKPLNRRKWYDEIRSWLERFLPEG